MNYIHSKCCYVYYNKRVVLLLISATRGSNTTVLFAWEYSQQVSYVVILSAWSLKIFNVAELCPHSVRIYYMFELKIGIWICMCTCVYSLSLTHTRTHTHARAHTYTHTHVQESIIYIHICMHMHNVWQYQITSLTWLHMAKVTIHDPVCVCHLSHHLMQQYPL